MYHNSYCDCLCVLRWRGEEMEEGSTGSSVRLNLVELSHSVGEQMNFNLSASTTERMVWSSQHVYVVMEQDAHGLNTFVTVCTTYASVLTVNCLLCVKMVSEKHSVMLQSNFHCLIHSVFHGYWATQFII